VGNRILIIEDDRDLARVTRLQLEHNGYQVTVCLNGTSGLQAVRESEPDLILLDILLPDMDGWDVCEQLRTITDVPIIIATALGTDKDMIHGIDLGADDYMIKPFTYAELVARVKTALHRAQRADSEE
jgi:DNA-binding response OmpR family regulator